MPKADCKAFLLESGRKLHSQFCMAEPGKTFPNVIAKSKNGYLLPFE